MRSLIRVLDKRRRAPVAIAERIARESARIMRRIAHPTGLVVGVVGPDGVGKSTLATHLEQAGAGVFRRSVRLHVGPGVLPPPALLLGRKASTGDNPHGQVPSGSLGSTVRTAYLVMDTLVGWPQKVWAPRLRSSLVILERGLHDLMVDPRRYRLTKPPGLVRHLARILPQPDLGSLQAPATVIHHRKPELPIDEIERQLAEWQVRAAEDPTRFRTLDASESSEKLGARALDAIDDVLADRRGLLDLAALAIECAGGPTLTRRPYSVVSAKGSPRWLLPRGLGPTTAGLYRPASQKHGAGA